MGGPPEVVPPDVGAGEADVEQPLLERRRVDGAVDVAVVEGLEVGTGDAVVGDEQAAGLEAVSRCVVGNREVIPGVGQSPGSSSAMTSASSSRSG